MAKWEKIQINATTMDKFCCNNNIMPDFIKMDIEGAEMPALEGGMKTIQECRPQLAISIYHSNEDFINIPLYLNKILRITISNSVTIRPGVLKQFFTQYRKRLSFDQIRPVSMV